MKKVLFTCIVFLGLGLTTSLSQTDKMKEKATAMVEQLNNDIIAGNEHLALKEEQKARIYNLHLERLKELRKANKAGVDKAGKKTINKKYYKEIYSQILTKHQKNARKIGKSRQQN
ncbi:hypothetical protein [Winogradskyella sp. PE311]|uniref:hypothetical protein n=1 Tax=Winogradskyella sp. PE311 TaxID=3366943 RepID=UPI0039805456